VVRDGSSLYSGGTVSRPLCMYGVCFLIKRGMFMAKKYDRYHYAYCVRELSYYTINIYYKSFHTYSGLNKKYN
jgi:hypothetical protein